MISLAALFDETFSICADCASAGFTQTIVAGVIIGIATLPLAFARRAWVVLSLLQPLR